MRRAILTYILLVLLPGLGLSLFAVRVADWDHAERLRALRADLESEAEALGRRIEGTIDDAARKARADPVAGLAAGGEWLGYSRGALASAEEDEASRRDELKGDELKYYELSVRGGESYELIRKDPGRALDAYSFYLPRIRSKVHRARLEFRAARAARALGESSQLERRLAEGILRQLFEEARGLSSEEGLPMDLLAASRLLEAGGGEGAFRSAARARLEEAAPRLSTPLLERLAAAIAPGDTGLRDVVEKRRILEAAVAACPEILAGKDAVLGDGFLLLAASEPQDGGMPSIRTIRVARLELPPLDAGGYKAGLERGGEKAPRGASGEGAVAEDAPGEDAAVRPVRLPPAGPVLAELRLEDPRHGEKLASLTRKRAAIRGLVGLLVVVTLGGGVALVRYLHRERRLAELRSKLLANVSHELKTPVTSIRMFSELLADRSVEGERARRFVEQLRAESQRLGGLFENLLDLSRLGRGDVDLPLEPVDLAALLRSLAGGFALRAEAEKVAFRTEGLEANAGQDSGAGGQDSDFTVLTNAPAVERIVLNLLDNALKYRREEGPEIRLSLAREQGRAAISVEDNGPGIPRGEREQVFQEFYRVRYDDYAVKGSGLGLSISRRLARKLGGDVTLASREGQGSTFILRLPLGDTGEQGTNPGS